MYPDRELTRLAAQKIALRRDIALRRLQCAGFAARIAQPVAWLDRVLAFWRRLTPLTRLAVPLGFLATRTALRRPGILGSLVRWGPLVYGAVRGLHSVVKNHRASAPADNGQG